VPHRAAQKDSPQQSLTTQANPGGHVGDEAEQVAPTPQIGWKHAHAPITVSAHRQKSPVTEFGPQIAGGESPQTLVLQPLHCGSEPAKAGVWTEAMTGAVHASPAATPIPFSALRREIPLLRLA
jgi:hypothetical protein